MDQNSDELVQSSRISSNKVYVFKSIYKFNFNNIFFIQIEWGERERES